MKGEHLRRRLKEKKKQRGVRAERKVHLRLKSRGRGAAGLWRINISNNAWKKIQASGEKYNLFCLKVLNLKVN